MLQSRDHRPTLPSDRLLSDDQRAETTAWLAAEQLPNGMLAWYRGGHADPWNHMEATMALAAGGHWAEVERAFAWLAGNQLADGSWCTYYVPDGVLEPRRDPNVCAYVATGAWWCSLLGGGGGLLEATWSMVERAIVWCLRYQNPGGEVVWSVGPDGIPGGFALVAANSSFQHSLRCAAEIAGVLGHDRPGWMPAARSAAEAVAGHVKAQVFGNSGGARQPEPYRARFAPKDRWAMDWYYPVLTGAVEGELARRRARDRWDIFVEEGLGARCVSDQQWVTAAETAECAMAMARAGFGEQAHRLLSWTSHLRDDDGAYWTGCAHPQCARFPCGQRSTYSAAAVVIADHVLGRRSPASRLFTAAEALAQDKYVSSPADSSSGGQIAIKRG